MVAPPPYVPDRGDLVWIDFSPQRGREQAGRRPALVVSPAVHNRPVGLALFCPVTSQVKGFRYEVVLPADLPVSGAILADHVKNLDWRARNAVLIGQAPPTVVDEVIQKVETLLR
jgi:mRNA interferase MazF